MKSNHNWCTWAFYIVIAMLLISSCPACVYIPIIRSSGERGIAEDTIPGIVVGKTTKEDVLLTFGCPTSESLDGNTFWYVWKITRGYIGGCVVFNTFWVGASSLASYRTLQISFDYSDTVKSYNLDKEFEVEPSWSFPED